jgi:cell division protein FtsZ
MFNFNTSTGNKKFTSNFARLDDEKTSPAILKVVGVGGAGCNAIESMIQRGIQGVEFVAINTDVQVLSKSNAHHKIKIGANITRGLGAGSDPTIGKRAAEESKDEIKEFLNGSDMVFITCGEGGGTGTGASPIVASIAKSLGALVVGIVTTPFSWEGKKRMANAEVGISELRQFVDSLIVIPNERILSIIEPKTPFKVALDKANEILYEATRGISDIINVPGLINVDFNDVRAVMVNSGEAIMGCGIASGENRAIEAAQKAISSPLLNGISIKGSKSVLLNITGPNSMTMQEIDEANKVIAEAAGAEASLIFGVVYKDDMDEHISYTVIATGFSNKNNVSNNSSSNYNSRRKDSQNSNHFKSNITDKQDLNKPTILRTGSDMLDEFFSNSTSFNESNKESNNDNQNGKLRRNDDDDISDFLRIVMD